MFTLKSRSLVKLNVNGQSREVLIRPGDILIDTLRDQLGLTGAKPGCLNGDCGACTVVIDGWPIKSCLMLTAEAIGKQITTVEGLENTPLQKAFIEQFAFMCGYCTSGFLMVCHALKAMHPNATDIQIDDWLQSNICRCTSYEEIGNAVREALASSQ